MEGFIGARKVLLRPGTHVAEKIHVCLFSHVAQIDPDRWRFARAEWFLAEERHQGSSRASFAGQPGLDPVLDAYWQLACAGRDHDHVGRCRLVGRLFPQVRIIQQRKFPDAAEKLEFRSELSGQPFQHLDGTDSSSEVFITSDDPESGDAIHKSPAILSVLPCETCSASD